MAVYQETRVVPDQKPVQLRLGWEKLERARREQENAARRREQVGELVLDWTTHHPGKAAVPKIIAESLNVSVYTARRRIKELLKDDPAFTGFVKLERARGRDAKPGPDGWTLATLGSRNVAYSHPDLFVPLGRVLREAGIHKTPGAAASILSDNGIDVKVIQSTYKKKGINFSRYFVSTATQGAIVNILSQPSKNL